jgi:Ca2+-binding RTX toxin-like protein
MAIFTQIGDFGNNTLAGDPGQENDIFGDALAMDRDRGGNDTLIGGANVINHLWGEALTMNRSEGGNDTLIGGAKDTPAPFPPELGVTPPDNVLCGDTGNLSIGTGDMTNSKGGKDILIGGVNAFNVIAGDTCHIMTNSEGGSDTLTGGENATNIMVGDAQSMIKSAGGNDTLIGGVNATNFLYGDAEYMTNSASGNDRLVSGANATDQMWGDFAVADDISKGGPSLGGNDIFVFAPGSGLDVINDFNDGPTGPQDRIDVSAYGFDDISDLVIVSNIVSNDSPNSVTIAFDGVADQLGDEVVVNGFGGSGFTLTHDDFTFFV